MNTSKASPRKGAASSARRRARQAALTGLYQWLISHEDPGAIQVHVEEQEVHEGCDRAHFQALLHGCIKQASALAANTSVDRRSAAALSSTPFTYLWPSVPPNALVSSTASLITTR